MKFRACLLLSCILVISPAAQADPVAVGVAKVDVTPTHPVALAGYGGRTREHEGVDTKIWARALAIAAKDPAVIIAAWNKHKDVVDYYLQQIPDKADGTNGLGVTINLAARQGWATTHGTACPGGPRAGAGGKQV